MNARTSTDATGPRAAGRDHRASAVACRFTAGGADPPLAAPTAISQQPSAARRRRAFTLIELLIVLLVVALLAGLILFGIGAVRERARVLQTSQRIESIQSGLLALGKDIGNHTVMFQRGIPGFGGTAFYEQGSQTLRIGSNDVTVRAFSPKGGARWHTCFPQPKAKADDPLIMAFPWGKARRYPLWTTTIALSGNAGNSATRSFLSETWYTSFTEFAFTLPPATAANETQLATFQKQWETSEQHTLAELMPERSAELMTLIGVAGTRDDYLRERGSSKAWNDAWGRPLVIAYALYQPPECALGTGLPRDQHMHAALDAYQYNRSIYFAVASAGPELRRALFPSDGLVAGNPLTTGDLRAIWDQACQVCMPTPAETWDENGFDRPPWKGIKLGRLTDAGKQLRSFLSAPSEVK